MTVSASAPCIPTAPITRRLEYPLYWVFSIGTAVAVLFQVRLPTRSGEVNANLGDPLAIMTALLMLGLAWQVRSFEFWRVRRLVSMLGLVTGVLAIALLRGYLVYGPIDWAIFNRFLGWLVLLSYLCSGALIVVVAGRTGFAVLCRVVVAAAVCLVLFEIATRFLATNFAIGDLRAARVEGMAGNPNAFAFQLLVAFAALIAMQDFRMRKCMTRPILLGGVLLAGLWLAGSRAAAGALVVMLPVPLLFPSGTDRAVYIRKLMLAVGGAAIVLVAPDALAAGLRGAGEIFAGLGSGLGAPVGSAEADRMESLRGGLAMWAAHPIFGAGLGAYIHEHIVATGIPLVIHNSPLWIAAEMGVLGLGAFGSLLGTILKTLSTERTAPTDATVLGVLCLVAVAVMSLAHDMLYQRLFWLMLGAALASPLAARRTRA